MRSSSPSSLLSRSPNALSRTRAACPSPGSCGGCGSVGSWRLSAGVVCLALVRHLVAAGFASCPGGLAAAGGAGAIPGGCAGACAGRWISPGPKHENRRRRTPCPRIKASPRRSTGDPESLKTCWCCGRWRVGSTTGAGASGVQWQGLAAWGAAGPELAAAQEQGEVELRRVVSRANPKCPSRWAMLVGPGQEPLQQGPHQQLRVPEEDGGLACTQDRRASAGRRKRRADTGS